MKRCPHCGKQIQENALGCPHCLRTIKASKDWYSMKMQGASSAEIFIYSDIGAPSFFNPDALGAKQFMEDLLALGPVTDLTIRINSYGGEIFDGTAIYYGLLDYKASKTVIIDGIAASQASVVAMVADPGKLKIRENAFLMVHEAGMCVCGTKRDFARYGKLLTEMEENAVRAYQRHATELSAEDIQGHINDESWFNAEDAKTYGYVDEIIEKTDIDEPATNTGKHIPINLKRICFNSFPNIPKTKPINKGDAIMHKCPHCGKEHAEKAAFCNACGKPMDQTAAHQREVDEARREAAANEQKRISEITSRCDKNGIAAEFRNKLVSTGVALDQAIVQILDEIERLKTLDPVPPPAIAVQKDEAEKFRMQATNSLSVALGTEKDPTVVAAVRKDPGPRDLHGLIRACLVKEGKTSRDDIDRMSPDNLAGHAIRMAGSMGSSDLPSILADTMNKEFKGGFEDAPTTFQEVCAETENPNFMTKSMTKLSGFSDIDKIPEGMSFQHGKFSDKKETIAVETFGKMLTLTRQLLINNDTSAIASFPRGMSSAMRFKMNRDFYDLLTYNSLVGPLTVEDGVAVFDDTAHGNLKATSGIPSVSSLGESDKKMMEQTLPKGTPDSATAYLNMVGSILLTGTANRMSVLQLLGSANDPAATDGKLVYNPYAGKIRPVFDAYLQAKLTAASKTYAWYMFAGPSMFRNWIVAYLSGNRTPTLRSEPSRVGEALGISYDIFFDYAFGIEDYRGVILNDGASA